MGNTALHVACARGPSCVQPLLDVPNLNLERANNRGSTALHMAAYGGNADTVKLLLEKGARILSTNTEGMGLK